MEYYDKDTDFGYLPSADMQRVWDVQLDLLHQFSQVCQRHGLRFWLEGGTLLGAVRHKGFIPWDDDIDVVMMRDDYDRMNRIAQSEFAEPYFWQTTYTDTDLYLGHAILRRTDTTCISPTTIDKPYCQGIGIDIFVLDGVPSNPVAYFLHRSAAKLLNGTIRWCIEKHVKWVSYKKLFSLYESLMRMHSIEGSKQIGLISWRYRHKEIHPRSQYLDGTVWLEFAGTPYPAPHDYTQWLIDYYGADYMIPVMGASIHGRQYLDASRPYQESVKLLKAQGWILS